MTPTPTTIRLGQLIRSERLWVGWTKETLAMHAGIGVRLIRRIESGDVVILETAIHLLHVLESGVGVLQLAEHLRTQAARHCSAKIPRRCQNLPSQATQPIR